MTEITKAELNRILLGSAIGALIGLVLLVLGVTMMWNATGARLSEAMADAAPVVAGEPGDEGAMAPVAPAMSASSYPQVPAAAPHLAVTPPVEERDGNHDASWQSIFETEPPPQAQSPVAPAVRTAPRPIPRPRTPREAPKAQRQDDSLFF